MLKYAAIVVVLIFFSVTNTLTHEIEEGGAVVIHVDENGFKPDKINIKVGAKVIFENVGKEDHWPAGNDHPSHTLYDGTSLEDHCAKGAMPSFDACGSIKSGEEWSFVFVKDGLYKYHDHLWPQFSGEILVGDLKKNDLAGSDIFRWLPDVLRALLLKNKETVVLQSGNIGTETYLGLKSRFEKLVVERDPREAIDALQEESSKDKQTLALCHDILHVVGHAAYGKYGSFKEAIKYQTDFCNSGYIHGLFESYFKQAKDPIAGLDQQCGLAVFGGREFDLWQCYHGMGHGFMYYTGGDLDQSLELCAGSLQEKKAALSCQNGVYMELFNSEVLAKEPQFVDPKNPFLTCAKRAAAKGDCYTYVPTYLSQTLGQNFSGMFQECSGVEWGYKHNCIGGVGSEAMKRNMGDPDQVFALCGRAGFQGSQELCVAGAVSMYMNHKGSFLAGKDLCGRAPKYYQDACHKAVANREAFFK